MKKCLRPHSSLKMMHEFDAGVGIYIVYAQRLLGFFDARRQQGNALALLILATPDNQTLCCRTDSRNMAL